MPPPRRAPDHAVRPHRRTVVMANRITRNPLSHSGRCFARRAREYRAAPALRRRPGPQNRLLDHLLRDVSIDQAVVFTATKREADVLSERLNIAGLNAAPLHGDMPQGARNRTLTALRRGNVRILVATDVAARGIDVPTITHVFNYDLPKFAEDYVRRIGRTGRAGHAALPYRWSTSAISSMSARLNASPGQTIPVEVVPGHEPTRRRLSPGAQHVPAKGGRPQWR